MTRFADDATRDIFRGEASQAARKRLPVDLHRKARAKLTILYATENLSDLKSPPGNRLEALKGDFRGLHSIRVNDQYRIVFRWNEGQAHDIRMTDYH
jgi:proteic killer suppression protein